MALAFETDAAPPARLGLIVLQTDETIEPELGRMFAGAGATLHVSRVPSAPDVTPETLAAMAAALPAAAALLPNGAGYGALGYGCTSGATVIGEAEVGRLVRGAIGEAPVTNPLSAVKAACKTLGVRRLGFVTPYIREVSARLRTALEADGIEIAGSGSFEQIEERVVARIAERSVLAAIEQVAAMAPCDAVFASCTNLRTLGIIEQAERRIGRPVLSSNQALAWHMLTLAGLPVRIDGAGRLLGG